MKLGFILADTGTQSKGFWSADYPLLLYEVPLHNDYVSAWCPVIAARSNTSTPMSQLSDTGRMISLVSNLYVWQI